MNFELKALNLGDLSREKCDAVLVLVTNAFNPGKDALSVLIAKAIKEGDLTAKSGQMLDIYRPLGLTCKRLVLIHTGDGATPDVRKAVTAAVALVKSAKPKQIAVFFLQPPTDQALRVAVAAVADASYVYVATKSKPEGRSIERAVFAATNNDAMRAVFDRAVGRSRVWS